VSSPTRWVLAHKRIVVIGWIVLTIAGIAAAGPASGRLTNDSSVPDREGWETTVAIAERYDGGPNGSSSPLLPVVTLPAGKTVDSPGVKSELAAVDARLQKALPRSRIASFASTGSRAFVSKDRRTVFALAYPPAPASSDAEKWTGALHPLGALFVLVLGAALVRRDLHHSRGRYRERHGSVHAR
jgi:putative drug exporter of the RND superfamily